MVVERTIAAGFGRLLVLQEQAQPSGEQRELRPRMLYPIGWLPASREGCGGRLPTGRILPLLTVIPARSLPMSW
jgi:hypothetical protein